MAQDPRFASQGARLEHIDKVYEYLARTLRSRTTDEWLMLFEQADLPAAALYSLYDRINDPHLRDVGLIRPIEHPLEGAMMTVANPAEWSQTPPCARRHAPAWGEHTVEVLREHGVSEASLQASLAERFVFSSTDRHRR